MTDQEHYFRYLKSRSRIGFLYRKFWLYPKLCRPLKGRTLDIGCGIGDFISYKANSIGVDINPEAVEWCTRRGLDARLMPVNILPFEDSSFDSVILDNVLEHLEKPQRLLEEISRIIVAGGVLLIGVPGRRGYLSDPDHKVFYDESLLTSTLLASGFKLGNLFYAPFHFAWLESRMRQYCLYGIFQYEGV
jgi:SAM-dependent methyltransferase